MYTVYIRKDLGPDYLKRLFGEMDVTISRNLPQISDWLGGGKFAVAIGGVGCNDLAIKGLLVAPVYFEGIAAVGAGTDAASWLASSRNSNAAKVFLNWILSREGQIQFLHLLKAVRRQRLGDAEIKEFRRMATDSYRRWPIRIYGWAAYVGS